MVDELDLIVSATGRAVRTRRLELHLTQGELLARLKPFGVELTQGYLSQIESGTRTGQSFKLILALCLALDLSIDQVIDSVWQGDRNRVKSL